jgi:nucleotide-binding universal stress UspA family protein
MAWLPKRNVVAPVDFSDQSFSAVDQALELVASPAELHLIHVLPVVIPADPGVVWTSIDDDSRRRHARLALEERFSDPKYQGAQIQVELGDPGHEIAAFAERIKADLIVVSSHGRTGLTRLLIGSVAERVVRLAHCPVLVLKH